MYEDDEEVERMGHFREPVIDYEKCPQCSSEGGYESLLTLKPCVEVEIAESNEWLMSVFGQRSATDQTNLLWILAEPD